MIYSCSAAPYILVQDKVNVSGTITGIWINPENGDAVQSEPLSLQENHTFKCPEGWGDSILIIK